MTKKVRNSKVQTYMVTYMVLKFRLMEACVGPGKLEESKTMEGES